VVVIGCIFLSTRQSYPARLNVNKPALIQTLIAEFAIETFGQGSIGRSRPYMLNDKVSALLSIGEKPGR
jgi:hypothetical protein